MIASLLSLLLCTDDMVCPLIYGVSSMCISLHNLLHNYFTILPFHLCSCVPGEISMVETDHNHTTHSVCEREGCVQIINSKN